MTEQQDAKHLNPTPAVGYNLNPPAPAPTCKRVLRLDRQPSWKRFLGYLAVVGYLILVLFANLRVEAKDDLEFFAARPGENSPLVFAHQGGAGSWPANTLLAFEESVATGADVLDADVHLTSDGELVLIHDETVDRTSNKTGAVRELSLSELKRMDFGFRFMGDDGDEPFPHRAEGLTIVTVRELFGTFPEARFGLEIKAVSDKVATKLCDLIEDKGLEDRVLVSSVDGPTMEEFRDACPSVATSATRWESIQFFAAQQVGLSGLLSPSFDTLQVPESKFCIPVLSAGLVDAAKRWNMPVIPWTIDKQNDFARITSQFDVDGINTNHPDHLVDFLEGQQQGARQGWWPRLCILMLAAAFVAFCAIKVARARVSSPPPVALFWAAASLAAAAISTSFLMKAVKTDEAGAFLFRMGLGALFGLLAVALFTRRVHPAVTEPRERTLSAIALVFFGVCLTILGLTVGPTWLIPVGLYGPVTAVMIIDQRLSSLSLLGARRWMRVFSGLAPVSILIWLSAMDGLLPPRVGTVGLAMWIGAVTALKVSTVPLIKHAETARKRQAGLLALLSLIVGSGLVLFASRTSTPAVLTGGVVGVALIYAGLTLGALTLSALVGENSGKKCEESNVFGTVGLSFAGLSLVLVALAILSALLPVWPAMVWAVVILAVTLGAFFVLKGEGVVFLILVGFLLVWVLEANTATPDTVTGSPTILAFGDSFAAGQGGERFLPFTNTQDSSKGNTCRRSVDAFVQILGNDLGQPVRNFACNGAETIDITRWPDGNKDPSSSREVSSGNHQLFEATGDSKFRILRPDDVQLVFVVVGGNDADFSTVVAACLLPGNCKDAESQILQRAADVAATLEDTYEEILSRFTEADLVVVGYPQYVGNSECGRSLTNEEVAFARSFIAGLNKSMKNAVDNVAASMEHSRLSYFDAAADLFDGHTICDQDPWANFLQVRSTEGPLLDRLKPISWIQGSAHPKREGHEALAEALEIWLERKQLLPTRIYGDVGPSEEPDLNGPESGSEDRAVGLDGWDADEWTTQQAARSLPSVVLALACLLAGGIMFALAAIGTGRSLFGLSPLSQAVAYPGPPSSANDVKLTMYDVPVEKGPRLIRFLGHVQGIALHESGSGRRTIFATVSISKWFSYGRQARLIYSNQLLRYTSSLDLPWSRHPGGLAILGDLMAIPCESPSRAWRNPFARKTDQSFLLFFQLGKQPGGQPEIVGFHELSCDPYIKAWAPKRPTSDSSKASAAAMAIFGGRLHLVVLSQNRFLRILRSDTASPHDLKCVRVLDTYDYNSWSNQKIGWPLDSVVDGIGLTVDDSGLVIHALALSPTRGLFSRVRPAGLRRRLAFAFAVGTDTVVDIHLPVEPTEDTLKGPLYRGQTREVGFDPVSAEPVRPSFRWGGSLQVINGKPVVLCVERFGSRELTGSDLNALQFAAPDNLFRARRQTHTAL